MVLLNLSIYIKIDYFIHDNLINKDVLTIYDLYPYIAIYLLYPLSCIHIEYNYPNEYTCILNKKLFYLDNFINCYLNNKCFNCKKFELNNNQQSYIFEKILNINKIITNHGILI